MVTDGKGTLGDLILLIEKNSLILWYKVVSTNVQPDSRRQRGGLRTVFSVGASFDREDLVHLQAHSVVNLVVIQGDVIFIFSIPAQTFDMSESGDATDIGQRLMLLFTYHFLKTIFDAFVPVWAAMSFLRSPTVSLGLHFTRTLRRSEL